MRVEGVRIKEVFQNVMDLAIIGANKVMADVAAGSKRLCPTKKGVSIGTIYRPYGRVMKDVLFTTKRGKDVNFIADTEMGRTAGNLRATIRKVEKDSRPGNIRVYCGNKDVWYGRFVEYGTSHSQKQAFMRPAFHAIKGTAQERIAEEMRREPEMKR
jgi:HK97 gp10 family phage protein